MVTALAISRRLRRHARILSNWRNSTCG